MMKDCLSEVLTAAEAGELSGFKPDTIKRAILEGRLRGRKSGPRIWLTTKKDLEDFMGKRTAVNYVYCPDCGEEYDAANNQHECDPDTLAQIAADEAADAEVRAKAAEKKERDRWDKFWVDLESGNPSQLSYRDWLEDMGSDHRCPICGEKVRMAGPGWDLCCSEGDCPYYHLPGRPAGA